MTSKPTIYLVDDEPGMLKALGRLLSGEGFAIRSFASARKFLDGYEPDVSGCLILDVAMPEMDGLQLQRILTDERCNLPVIFLTGHGDIPMAVRAMRAGAVNFLTKPVGADELLAAIRAALKIGATRAVAVDTLNTLKTRLNSLSPREFEVMRHVITGKLNKQIAIDLGVVEQTIKVHRMRLMQKLGLQSVAELVRVAERLGVTAAS